MIGTCILVKRDGLIVGLKCAKGRGVTLPGGKWEKGESFIDCAKRELLEETGLLGHNFKLVFNGESEEGYFTYAFTAEVNDYTPLSSHEGEVTLTNWDELKRSRFGGYYELLQQVLKEE